MTFCAVCGVRFRMSCCVNLVSLVVTYGFWCLGGTSHKSVLDGTRMLERTCMPSLARWSKTEIC